MSGSRRRLLGARLRRRGLGRHGGCAAYISPLQPPPYRDQVVAPYDVTWAALIRALAYDQRPAARGGQGLRRHLVGRHRLAHRRLCRLRQHRRQAARGRGHRLVHRVRATATAGPRTCRSTARCARFRLGKPGQAQGRSSYECVSTTRWEPNLRGHRSPLREGVADAAQAARAREARAPARARA